MAGREGFAVGKDAGGRLGGHAARCFFGHFLFVLCTCYEVLFNGGGQVLPHAPVNNPSFGPRKRYTGAHHFATGQCPPLHLAVCVPVFGDRECGLDTRNARQARGQVGPPLTPAGPSMLNGEPVLLSVLPVHSLAACTKWTCSSAEEPWLAQEPLNSLHRSSVPE